MQDHIVKSFDIEIARLKESIMDMAKKCGNQLEKSIQAFKLMDRDLAQKVVDTDTDINALEKKIEENAVAFLAKRQPVAVDLRQLLCVMRMANELERIGDYAAGVAKRVTLLDGDVSSEHSDLIISMANIARVMLHDISMAFLMLDLNKAVDVWNKDDEIDRKYSRLVRGCRESMQADPSIVEDATHLMFIGRCCERIGDHITNISEDIYYIISGKNFLDQFGLE